jgi:hypothetical protein
MWLVWNLMAVCIGIALYEAWILPDSINLKKIEPRVNDAR